MLNNLCPGYLNHESDCRLSENYFQIPNVSMETKTVRYETSVIMECRDLVS
jgi:hypothetical protein